MTLKVNTATRIVYALARLP